MKVQTPEGLKEVELVGKGTLINNPNKWDCCMYRLPKSGDMLDDLVVTGGHSILKEKISYFELEADRDWFLKNKEYSRIGKYYLVRAAFCKDFLKITGNSVFEYYHFSLKSPHRLKRYAVWANGILSESTFKNNVLKLIH